MTSRLAGLALLLVTLLAGAGHVFAQSDKRSPLGIAPPAAERGLTAQRPPSGMAGPARADGVTGRVWSFVVEQQRRFSREMSAAVRQMKTEPFGPAFLSLAFLSFVYGVLHAAGPGHGKFVISSYALATERTVRRGILLSFLAAFFQALSAIALFGALALVMGATKRQFDVAEAWLESLSWALVAMTGAWLLVLQIKLLRDSSGHHRRHGHSAHAHDHDHAHAHAHAHADLGPAHAAHIHDHKAHGCTQPDHVHGHQHDESCGHMHMPDPSQLDGQWSWGRAIALAASVGVRPCSGALIVLAFALLNGILWAGVFATFAMALGTALTVSALAAIAVGSKELATRLAGGDGKWASRVAAGAGLAGGAIVLIFGTVFFIASLKAAGPL